MRFTKRAHCPLKVSANEATATPPPKALKHPGDVLHFHPIPPVLPGPGWVPLGLQSPPSDVACRTESCRQQWEEGGGLAGGGGAPGGLFPKWGRTRSAWLADSCRIILL